MGNISGSFRSIDRSGLQALKQAAENDGAVDANEVAVIQEAFQEDGSVSDGEHQLIQQLQMTTQDGQTVKNLQLTDFDPTTRELSFDVQFGEDNQGRVTPEAPSDYISNLSDIPRSSRSQLARSLQGSGLPGIDQKKVAQTLNRTGTPTQAESVIQAMQSATGSSVRNFGQRLLALSPPEQQAVVEIAEQLQQTPPPVNLVTDLRAKMAGLPAPNPPSPNVGRGGFAVGQTLNALGLYLPPTNPNAPGVEDASGRLENAVMGGYPRSSPQDDYIRDMIGVAQQENFKVTVQVSRGTDIPALKQNLISQIPTISTEAELDQHLTLLPSDSEGYVWAEDNKWIQADGSVVTTPDADFANIQSRQFTDYDTGIGPNHVGSQGHHTAGQPRNDTNNLVPHDNSQGAVTDRNEHNSAETLSQALGRGKARTTRTYNEGGNMLVGSFPNGDPYAVIGKDGVIASTFHLREQFSQDPASVTEFLSSNIKARQQQMGLDGAFATLPADTQTLIDDTAQRLLQGPLTPANTASARADAIEFMVQQDIVKDIFATDVGVSRENLIFIDQPEFHIDMHMRPVAPGQIMVNDFAANERLLKDAISRATPGSWEETELQGMLKHNTEMASVMGDVMSRISSQLQEGGLEVVSAPGVMEGPMANPHPTQSDPSRHVNFMNAIPSTRPGTNEQIYITNYTSIAPLRAAFEDYAQTQGIEKVYWVGDQGGGEQFKSAAESSLWPGMGGLDCRENH